MTITVTERLIADPALHTDTSITLAVRHECSVSAVSLARRLVREAASASGQTVPVAKAGRPPSADKPERVRRTVAIERAEVVAFLRGLGLGEAAEQVEAGEHVGARKT